MTKYSCSRIIGSLVYRAQGYKRLTDEIIMASKAIWPDTENVVAHNIVDNVDQTLKMGSLVIINELREDMGYAEIKLIDFEKRTNSPEEQIFRCPIDCLIQVNEKVWNLIAAISSPIEKINIATNHDICKELCSIDVGNIVRVLPSDIGIVTYKGPVNELGPGTYFKVKLFNETNEKSASHRYYYYTADVLRLKSTFLEEINQKDSRNLLKNNIKMFHDQYYIHSKTKNIEKLNEVSDLMTEDEFLRKRSRVTSEIKEKQCSMQPNEVRVDDLLGIIDEVDNYAVYKNSCGISKELWEDDKSFLKNKNNSSLNDFYKHEILKTVDENTNSDELGVGSVVEVLVGDEPRYGVIKWIGSVIYGDLPTKPKIVGVEMEEENPLCTDGCLNGHKYFDCAPQRGLFTLLSFCKKDSRFQDSSTMGVSEVKTSMDFGCAVIPGIIEPINQIEKLQNMHLLCGKYKGIQGHNNSCYLDATLFSMFTFTSVFDNLLLRPANKNDISSYEEVQRVLREEIVNPLRKNVFVRADRVMKLRTLLDNLTSVTGLTCEEKDPEEFLTSLVAQVLKAEPFLKLSSGHEAYYYQLFVEKDERLKLPTVQQLFEQSLITSDIKLKEVPSCLIIQMPRFGKSYKMYPRILPSQILDVTDVIENSPRQCVVCGQLAEYECKDCFKHCYNGFQYFSCCEQCVKKVHSHEERLNHKWNRILVPQEFRVYNNNGTIPRQYMELFAVLCIETSHYVAFVKCGLGPESSWCFFDSMADRKGELNGYNIPEMVLCPDLSMWLSDNGAQSFCEIKDDRHLPTYAKRLLCDAYMCMYQSTDIMMYR
ncbi:hypothetical protein PGB90_006433 [Kerria lacca]